jgi:hypothetical protein
MRPMANEQHIQHIETLRTMLVKQRRASLAALAERPHLLSSAEREIIARQKVINALNDALRDEQADA